MEFSQLTNKAIEVRDLINQLNQNNVGHIWSNREVMEGMVGDVGDLMKLVMAKEGSRVDKNDIDENIKHEICDILWCLINLADRYNFDLETVFMEQMEKLKSKVSAEITDN